MSYKPSIASSESEYEQFEDLAKNKPSTLKTKNGLKRRVNKCIEKKSDKKKPSKISTSYREGVKNLLKSEDYETEVENSITFRQGDGVITIKAPFIDGVATEYWTISHYKRSNIKNVPAKDRWKHSEATVKLYTSENSGDQVLHSSLNQTMQVIFDTMLNDPSRRTIKSNTVV